MANYLTYRAFVVDSLKKLLAQIKIYFGVKFPQGLLYAPDPSGNVYNNIFGEDLKQRYNGSDFVAVNLVSGYTVETYNTEGDMLMLDRVSIHGDAFLTYAILKKNNVNALYAIESCGTNGNNVHKIAEIATNSEIDSCVSESGILGSS